MRLLALVLLVAGLAGAHHWWQGRAATATMAGNENGFVAVEMPEGAPRNAVLILAPPNCPSDEARRAEGLASDLAGLGIPVTRSGSMSFALENPTAEQRAGVERAVAVFRGGAPAVFVNGMAMSNPTAAQAAAEYRRTRAKR
jgi:hypothetical protein